MISLNRISGITKSFILCDINRGEAEIGCHNPFFFLCCNPLYNETFMGNCSLFLTCHVINTSDCYNFTMTMTIFEMKYIEDIYFFEVNTKYISSNVLKISVISRVCSTSEIADIFNT